MTDRTRQIIGTGSVLAAAAVVLALLVGDRTLAALLATDRVTLVPSYDLLQTELLVGIGVALALGTLVGAGRTDVAQRVLLVAGHVILAWTIVADPYAHGLTTGDELIVRAPWQKVVAAAQLVAIVLAAVLVMYGAATRALWVLVAEGAVFLFVNVGYLLRDGTTRITGAPAPVWMLTVLLTGGVLLRVALIIRTKPGGNLAAPAVSPQGTG